MIRPAYRTGEDDLPVAVELDERRAGLVKPLDRVQGDEPISPQDDQALEPRRGGVEASEAALSGDTILTDKVAALHTDTDAIAVEYSHAGAYGDRRGLRGSGCQRA